ncbi:MAG: hypothetical protein KC550_00345, partial [Nanoarchaeota archaeon]|nr:hypothetical protein [Nanoarchaeota archaeon]
GGAYDVSTVKNIMGSSPVNLVENSKKGLVAAISADVENGNISLLKTQIGYTLPPSNNGVKFGFNGVYSHKPYDVNGDSFGLSSYYSKGSVKLEGKVSNDAWKLNFNYRF